MRKLTGLILVLCLLVPAFVAADDDMIQITVEVTEINNNKARELGIKWLDTVQFGEVSWSVDGRSPDFLPEVPALMSAGDFARWTAFRGDIKLLQTKGAAKILSKPKLLTRSGTSAEFRVGGEFPVVASGVGGGSIEWKEYGIILKIKPVALGDKKVQAEITTEISRLDWTNQVQNVPALSSRGSHNSVTIKSGQTITIAGLTETKSETSKTGVPLLMDLPILGYLFGRETVTEVQNTVLIFITPELVK